MHINLSPQVRDGALQVFKYQDTLVVNGIEYDFSQLPEGAILPSVAVDCEYLVGDVRREGGVVTLTLLLPVQWNSPSELRFPEPIVDAPDGKILEVGGQYDN